MKRNVSQSVRGNPRLPSESASRLEKLRAKLSFREFALKMRPVLPEMKREQREELLKKLHRMCIGKQIFDEYAPTSRARELATRSYFRKYRLWLASVSSKLDQVMKAMQEVVDAANNQPPRQPNDLEEVAIQVVNRTVRAIIRAGNELAKVDGDVTHFQFLLAAGINPKLRTPAEEKLVPHEPKGLKHGLLLGENTRQIDLLLSRYVGDLLSKYRTRDGRPIPRDKTIARLWFVVFGIKKEEDSIKRDLSRHRGDDRS